MVDRAGLDFFCSSLRNALLEQLDEFLQTNQTVAQGGILKGGLRLVNNGSQAIDREEKNRSMIFFARATVPNFDQKIFQGIRNKPAAVAKEFGDIVKQQISARIFQDMHDVAVCALRGAISKVKDGVYDLSSFRFVGELISREKDRLPADHNENTVDWLIHHDCAMSYFGKNTGQMKNSDSIFITRDQLKNSFIISPLDRLKTNDGRYYNIGAVPGAVSVTIEKFDNYFDDTNDFYRAHWQYDVRVKNCRWNQRTVGVEPTLDDLINPASWTCYAKDFDELPGIILVTR